MNIILQAMFGSMFHDAVLILYFLVSASKFVLLIEAGSIFVTPHAIIPRKM